MASRQKRRTRTPGRPAGNATGRAALLQAAKVEFAERGYAGARTQAILDRAEVTAPVLYHHFGSKAGLYVAVAEEVNDVVLAGFEQAVEPKKTLLARLDAILDASIELQASDPMIAGFVVAAPVDFGRHPELASMGPQMTRLREFVERVCADVPLPRRVTRQQAVQVILTLIFGLSRLAVTMTPSEYAKAIAGMRALVRGAFATEPAGR